MKFRTINVIAVLLIISFLMSCGGKDADKNKAGDVAVFAVNTSTAVQGQVWDYIALSGNIVAGSTVDVFSDVAGKVTNVNVQLGSRVNRGTPIAAVDPSRPGMNFRPSVATAPISGTVIALPAQVGATVSQAVPLARISGSNALEIELYIAERFISKIALNQSCEVTLDAWPGDIFRGIITEISPVVDPASRTMQVKVNVTNQNDKLKEGMFAKVRVITEQKENTVKIPASSLIQRFGETYVYVVEELPAEIKSEDQSAKKKGFLASIFGKIFGKKDDKKGNSENTPPAKRYIVKKRIVQPGILIDGVQEILSGLKAGEEFIVKGQTLLNDDSRVNVIERVAPIAAER